MIGDLTIAAVMIIAVALAFDFVNGFHDAANSIATSVSTRVLSPQWAVLWAAFWNFIAFAVFGTAVASTIGKGVIDVGQLDSLDVLLAALVGAIVFDLITWYYGLPTSSSHALIGGLAGAAVAFAGPSMLVGEGISRTAIFIVISPLLGMFLAVVLMNLALAVGQTITRRRILSLDHLNTGFRRLQLVSAAAYSLGHGANDAQKTMGVIAAVILVDQGLPVQKFEVSMPIVLAAHAAIALGTAAGGWRIVHTLGSRITKLQPVGGFSAETAAAMTLFGTANLGIPVSTTHTITGAIIGVGTVNRFSAVRWGLTRRVIYAWVLTIPGSALIAAATYFALQLPLIADLGIVIALAAAASVIILFRRRARTEATIFSPP
ncbi:MAG TPA: inorganic phosphate transporter [Candidatus Limnocylindrales bacterium]|nr:inorganic phosphate transporter [Candidatus Limnocylindrales bacterium]